MGYSVIIVNYRSSALLKDCLKTIQDSFSQGNEIIIVDSFSRDDSEQITTSAFPQVRWIQMDYNAGFARANNEGIRQSKGEIVLLLNPDTLNEGDAIAECYKRLNDSEYIAAGVQLLNTDRTPQVSGNYFMTGGLNHLMALPYLGRVVRWLGYSMQVKKTNVAEAKGVVEVDWINGAFLMVKKEAIQQAGLLDEDFFLYSEEIEWCSRLRKTGKMCIYGDLHVVHLQGESTNEAFGSAGKGYYNLSDKKGLQLLLSGFVRIRKQFGIAWFVFHLLAHLFTIPVFFIILVVKTLFFCRGMRKEWKGGAGYTTNVLKCAGYFFRIVRNKPYFYKVL